MLKSLILNGLVLLALCIRGLCIHSYGQTTTFLRRAIKTMVWTSEEWMGVVWLSTVVYLPVNVECKYILRTTEIGSDVLPRWKSVSTSLKQCLVKTPLRMILCQCGWANWVCGTFWAPRGTCHGWGSSRSNVGAGLSRDVWAYFHWHSGWLLVTEMCTREVLKNTCLMKVFKYWETASDVWTCIGEITILITNQYICFNFVILEIPFIHISSLHPHYYIH